MFRSAKYIAIAALVSLSLEPVVAHDAWLAARWDKKKTRILVSAVVGEVFSTGEPIKDFTRFIDPRAITSDGSVIKLAGEASDSTLLGSLPAVKSAIVASTIKQREVSYKRNIAELYLKEEIGYTKEETAQFLGTAQEFHETYTRHVKALVATGGNLSGMRDTSVGLPIELILVSFKAEGNNQARLHVKLTKEGKSIANAPVRVVVSGKTQILRTNASGEIETTVSSGKPILIAYIELTKIDSNRLNSVWTNLAIYPLK